MKKIMIIDDSEADQFLSIKVIQKVHPDAEILQAYDGKQALEMLEKLDIQPYIIFLDINMPVMNGHEFLEEYNKCDYDIPIVIMLTSSDQEVDKQRSRAYNCVKDYLAKPLTEPYLEVLLEKSNDL